MVIAVTLPDLPPSNLTYYMSSLSVRRAIDYNFVAPDPTTLIDMRDVTSIYIKEPVLLIDQAVFEASVNQALKSRGGMQQSNWQKIMDLMFYLNSIQIERCVLIDTCIKPVLSEFEDKTVTSNILLQEEWLTSEGYAIFCLVASTYIQTHAKDRFIQNQYTVSFLLYLVFHF